MKTLLIILLLGFAFAAQPAFSEDITSSDVKRLKSDTQLLASANLTDGAVVRLRIENQIILAEIASTPQSREHGLMQRNSLCDNCGMLFVFDKADRYSFWMKNTLLPLSIAFIDKNGSILNIDEMLANTLNIHNSHGEALYALEMNKGWFIHYRIAPPAKIHVLKR
jgi:uncharacterized membrane protein (UPF0127 family)